MVLHRGVGSLLSHYVGTCSQCRLHFCKAMEDFSVKHEIMGFNLLNDGFLSFPMLANEISVQVLLLLLKNVVFIFREIIG